jgi:hypothetical protein
MARHFLNLPDIYCFTRKPAPMPVVEKLCVFTSNAQQNTNIINVDQVYELVCHELIWYTGQAIEFTTYSALL